MSEYPDMYKFEFITERFLKIITKNLKLKINKFTGLF